MLRITLWSALALLSAMTAAQAGPVGVRVSAKSAPVLGAPAMDAAAVGAAGSGQVYGAVARSGLWIQIVFNGGAGWVAAADLVESGPVSAVALTVDALVRSGPGTAFAPSGAASAGQTYAALSSDGVYVEVTFGGGSGYVPAGSVVPSVLGGSVDDLGPGLPLGVRLPVAPGLIGDPLGTTFYDPFANLSTITSVPSTTTTTPTVTAPQYTTGGNDPRTSYATGGADDTVSATTSSGGGGSSKCFAAAAGGGISGLALLAGVLTACLGLRRR